MSTVFITGGAGGIGSAICRRMAEAGWRVALLYRSNQDTANALRDSLPGYGHLALQADVTDSASLNAMAQHLRETCGSIAALVNCHGVTTPVPHDDLDALNDEWIDRIFMTNWRGAFACIRALKPLLLMAAERGELPVIINISSVAGVTGVGSNVAYAASKAALDSMTRSLARALAPRIRVMSVSPGWVLGEYAARFPQEYIDAQTRATPTGRLSIPQDVAAAVHAVITALTNTTGSILPVDGGRPLGI